MALRERIRIRLKAYDHRIWISPRRKLWIPRSGPAQRSPVRFRCPHRGISHTVLRSPHVDKKSREQFEIRTHKRLLDILEPTQQTVDALMKLDLPAGVDVEIKAFGKYK